MSFQSPLWFLVLLFFPLLLWARYFWRGRGGRIPFSFRIWEGNGFSAKRSLLPFFVVFSGVLGWLGALSLVVALTGPVQTVREEVVLSRGIDIMVVLDQSPSMAARDFPPINRFDTAREMISRFIEGRSGDAVGLVGFGGDALLRSPPTTDYPWLLQRLNDLNLRDLGDETAIGMGLALAVLHLSDSTASEKVILLLTDGDDNAGEIRPETAASLAAERSIRLYAIGIGSQGEVPIELEDPETGTLTRGTIFTNFDEDRLRNLAESTGGGYWRAASPGALETVFQAVDSLEAFEKKVSLQVRTKPLHRPFIIVGALLVLTSVLIRKGLLGEMP